MLEARSDLIKASSTPELGMRQKLKHQYVQNFCSWFMLPRRAQSELCNQSGGEKHGQKGKRDWYLNKCIIY